MAVPGVYPGGGKMRFRRVLGAALLLAAAASLLTLTGCACKTSSCAWGDADKGLILEYRMSEGDPMSYRFTSNTMQTMEIQGQSIPIDTVETLEFTIEPKGMKGADNALGITIDGLAVSASTPQGDAEADTEDVVGKSFDMTVSKLGVEGGLPEPDDLMYTVGAEGPRSVITGFGVIFPDLPDYPVVVGDTWPASLQVTDENDVSSVVITIDAVNTIDGMETVNGLECVRIAATLTGTIEGGGAQQGVEWTMDSEMDGVGTWYFAYKEGILVSDWTEGTADGTITIDAPDGEVVMPVAREYDMFSELLK
jgi:hypothetical protein